MYVDGTASIEEDGDITIRRLGSTARYENRRMDIGSATMIADGGDLAGTARGPSWDHHVDAERTLGRQRARARMGLRSGARLGGVTSGPGQWAHAVIHLPIGRSFGLATAVEVRPGRPQKGGLGGRFVHIGGSPRLGGGVSGHLWTMRVDRPAGGYGVAAAIGGALVEADLCRPDGQGGCVPGFALLLALGVSLGTERRGLRRLPPGLLREPSSPDPTVPALPSVVEPST